MPSSPFFLRVLFTLPTDLSFHKARSPGQRRHLPPRLALLLEPWRPLAQEATRKSGSLSTTSANQRQAKRVKDPVVGKVALRESWERGSNGLDICALYRTIQYLTLWYYEKIILFLVVVWLRNLCGFPRRATTVTRLTLYLGLLFFCLQLLFNDPGAYWFWTVDFRTVSYVRIVSVLEGIQDCRCWGRR